MTRQLYFLTCASLAFGPPTILINNLQSKLPKDVLVYGSLAYILTSLAKFILIATFASNTMAGSSVFRFLALLNVFGLHVVISSLSLKNASILSIVLGFIVAEDLFQRVGPIWMESQAREFDWGAFLIALEANIRLVWLFGQVTLIFLWKVRDLKAVDGGRNEGRKMALICLGFEVVACGGVWFSLSRCTQLVLEFVLALAQLALAYSMYQKEDMNINMRAKKKKNR